MATLLRRRSLYRHSLYRLLERHRKWFEGVRLTWQCNGEYREWGKSCIAKIHSFRADAVFEEVEDGLLPFLVRKVYCRLGHLSETLHALLIQVGTYAQLAECWNRPSNSPDACVLLLRTSASCPAALCSLPLIVSLSYPLAFLCKELHWLMLTLFSTTTKVSCIKIRNSEQP